MAENEDSQPPPAHVHGKGQVKWSVLSGDSNQKAQTNEFLVIARQLMRTFNNRSTASRLLS